MLIDTSAWSPETAKLILDVETRRMPLVRKKTTASRKSLGLSESADRLFSAAQEPAGLLTGILLLHDCWKDAHEVAQDLNNREGSYWHAVIHRLEPDAWNSGYWFRRVGQHPIYPDLHAGAIRLTQDFSGAGASFGKTWDASRFIEICEAGAQQPGSDLAQLAVEVQHLEWQLLMAWCTNPR
jgi:hypothetical protein